MAHNAAAAAYHGEGLRLPETSSRCVTEGAVHSFEITNCALLEGIGVGKYVTSSTFSAGGYHWNIKFYPDGFKQDEDSAGNASAYVFYLSEDKDVRAKITLTLLDDQGNAQEIYKDYVYEAIFSQKNTGWGFPKFAEKSKLKSPPLTLRCVLIVITEPPTECETIPIVVPPSKLTDHLERALKNGTGADVTLLLGGREFRAHRFMLAARSPVLEAQLFGPMIGKDTQHIEINDMEPAIFEMLLHFLYTDSLPLCNEKEYDAATMQHLLVAADRYGLDRLKVMCEKKLCKSIDIKTVKSTLALASQHYCEGLKNACLEFMSRPGVAAIVFTDGIQRLRARPTPFVLEENPEDK